MSFGFFSLTILSLKLEKIATKKKEDCFKNTLSDKAMLSHTETIFIHPHIVFGSQGAGTDDDVLIEILASRTGEQIKDIIKVYKKGDFLGREGDKQKQI